jgi:glycerol-3-phosphate acyltransferase PlsY
MFIELLLICFISYIFGSIPPGYIIGKLKGVDLRSKGSGNIGASNAFRVLGKKRGHNDTSI